MMHSEKLHPSMLQLYQTGSRSGLGGFVGVWMRGLLEWRQVLGRNWEKNGRQMRKFDDIWSWDFDLIHFLHEWRNGHWMCCAAPHLHPLLSLSSSRGSEGLGAVTCWNMTNKQKNKFSGEKVPGTVNREMHAEFCRGADTKVVATHGAPGTWMIKYD